MRMQLLMGAIAIMMSCSGDAYANLKPIPFVGCPSDGQAGFLPPPTGSPKVVGFRVPTEMIAYYKGQYSLGVFAPRGWNCRVVYGASGSAIVVSPVSLDPSEFPPSKIRDLAVELEYIDGEKSGRFRVASYASRLFPGVAKELIAQVKSEGIEVKAADALVSDSVTYPERAVARFETLAGVEGLGTQGTLAPTTDAIRGLVVFRAANRLSMTILRVRLKPELEEVAAAIAELNEYCLRSAQGSCR